MLEQDHIWLFFFLLGLIAFLYASVGHGGGSGYLALMAIFGFHPAVMKPTALLLNVFVAAIAFYYYWRAGHFRMKLFIYFALASVPFAFLGGMLELETTIYKWMLAAFLLFATIRMLGLFQAKNRKEKKNTLVPWLAVVLGGLIGFISGLIGMGGGVILSPLILLLAWGKMKEVAAVSALFVWVNSIAAIIGQYSSGIQIETESFALVVIAVLGGYLGASIGSKLLSDTLLKRILAAVLLIACLKLLFA